MIKITVFSHRQGQVEDITCDDYKIMSQNGCNHVAAYKGENEVTIIPWNRIKQINVKNESEEN